MKEYVRISKETKEMLNKAHENLKNKGYSIDDDKMLELAIHYHGLSRMIKEFVKYTERVTPKKTESPSD